MNETIHPFGYVPAECPKCGIGGVSLSAGCSWTAYNRATEAMPEHLGRGCRCGWSWKTETKDAGRERQEGAKCAPE